ncbi:MAG: hypothetical protein MI919_42835, partial [Holophagales bacterium]|nr:hypothetical protein [Holophagales bacterium]
TVGGPQAVQVLVNDQEHGFVAGASVTWTGGPLAWADLGRRGTSDLVAGDRVHRHQGLGQLAAGEVPAGWPETADGGVPGGTAATAVADFDADGRLDLATISGDGALHLLANCTEDRAGGRWIGIALEGTKNLRLAPGSEVEVKVGAHYQKKLYRGTPLVFSLRGHGEVDTVRITWPNGLIQNETDQPAGELHTYVEAQRLSGSCPMIYTWNGEEFEFITDVLGVAPLGATAGEGEYFPLDHDEIVQIPGESLVERDGVYEVRIVEELREVAFLDEIRLIAVDHGAELEIFTNDKFKGPPFPEFRLFGVEERIYPVAARDHNGQDVTERLSAKDAVYADTFARRRDGTAEPPFLELDFGQAAADGRAILVLSGWVDWADASTFLGTSQGSAGLA